MPTHHHFEDLRQLTAQEVREFCQASPGYVHELDEFGETPLMAACLLGKTDLVQVLLASGAKVNFVADDGDTPLKLAVYSSQENFNRDLFDLLFDAGVDPNRGSYEPALHVAVSRGNRDIVRYLIERGADPNLRDIDETPPLFWAGAYNNRPDVIMMGLLVSLGADINQCDELGRTLEQRIGREAMLEVQRHSHSTG